MSEARGIGCIDVYLHTLIIRARSANAYTGNGAKLLRVTVPIGAEESGPTSFFSVHIHSLRRPLQGQT